MRKENKVRKIALLVACASVLQSAEFLLPSPLPGVKLGLANIITLIVLADMGFLAALEVAVLRTVVSSLFLGTFLSPTFILSLSGALVSTLAMGSTLRFLGFISSSILGSVVHILTQVLVVYFLVIRHPGVFALIPWLGLSAVVMGWGTGLVALNVFKKIRDAGFSEKLPAAVNSAVLRKKIVHSGRVSLKVIVTFLLSALVLVFSDLRLYAAVFVFLLAVSLFLKVPLREVLKGAKRLRIFLIFSLLIPVLFTKSGNNLVNWHFINITSDGLYTGSIFIFRLILLMMATSLLSLSTKAEELAGSLKKLIGDRLSRVVMISWENIPVFWERSRLYIKSHKIDRTIFRKAVPIAINLVAMLYAEAEQAG